MSEYEDPDGRGKVVVTASLVYEPDTQIERNTTCQKIPGQPPIFGHLHMRMFFPQELDALVKYNGFHIVNKYAGTDETPFDSKAEYQVIVAEMAHADNAEESPAANE